MLPRSRVLSVRSRAPITRAAATIGRKPIASCLRATRWGSALYADARSRQSWISIAGHKGFSAGLMTGDLRLATCASGPVDTGGLGRQTNAATAISAPGHLPADEACMEDDFDDDAVGMPDDDLTGGGDLGEL